MVQLGNKTDNKLKTSNPIEEQYNKEISKLHEVVSANPRTPNTEPEQDPKLVYLNKKQNELSYVIELNKATIEDKITLLEKRIKGLDDNDPDYFNKIKAENDLYHKIVDKPLSKEELAKLETMLARSNKSEAVATAHLREAYEAFITKDEKQISEKFKLADNHLENALKEIIKAPK